MSEVLHLPLDEMLKRFESVGKNILPSVYVAMVVSAERMIKDVIEKRMSGPSGAPGILGVVTGAGRRSMRYRVSYSNERLMAILGTLLGYIDVHERGANYLAWVRAHDRTEKRYGRKAKFYDEQGTVRGYTRGHAVTAAHLARQAAISKYAGGTKTSYTHQVRAHNRHVHIIAKHFMRDTVRAAKISTETRIGRALAVAAKTGRPPTPREIGA